MLFYDGSQSAKGNICTTNFNYFKLLAVAFQFYSTAMFYIEFDSVTQSK